MTDRQLLKIATGFRAGILDGRISDSMCFIVCAPLAGLLSVSGIEVEQREGEIDCGDYVVGHHWLELADGRILDPTADQFSTEARPMPDVYIGPRPDWYGRKGTDL